MLAVGSGTGPGSTLCLLKILATSVLYICENLRRVNPSRATRWFRVVHQHAKRPAFTSFLSSVYSPSRIVKRRNTSAFFEVLFSLFFWNGSVMSKDHRDSFPGGPI